MSTKNDNNQRLLTRYKIILTALISSLTITGISCFDNKICNIILIVIGLSTYSIVGLLYSIGLLKSKSAGKLAYTAVFIVLSLVELGIYKGLIEFQMWVSSWPLWIKISVPIMLLTIVINVFNRTLQNKYKQQSVYTQS